MPLPDTTYLRHLVSLLVIGVLLASLGMSVDHDLERRWGQMSLTYCASVLEMFIVLLWYRCASWHASRTSYEELVVTRK